MIKPKQHPQTALTGRLGVNLIERHVTRMGHAWNETTLDAGIDGVIELCRRDTREALNRVILVQSKATTGRFTRETVTSFEWVCDPRDVDYWMQGNAPVILVVSRSGDAGDESYWVDVKSYFADPAARKSSRVLFDKHRDRFDEDCSEALMQLGAPTDSGLYLAAPPRPEVLHSNLLRIASYTPTIFVADTEYRTPDALWAHLKREGIDPGSEWFLNDHRIYSFLDLEEEPFGSICCDRGSIEAIESDHWAQSEDRELMDVFVRLVRKALRQKLWALRVRYDHDEKHYHFMASKDRKGYSISYRAREKTTSRTVFEAYPDKRDAKKIAYYRHSAFSGNFLRFDGIWYLEITPTYRFTSDGYHVHRFAADYLKKIKEIELNDAVAGQLIMWGSLLGAAPDLLAPAYPHLSFGELQTFEIGVGIDDGSWHPADSSARSAEETGDRGGTLDLFTEATDEG